MVIYTKRGDGGETSIFRKKKNKTIRISKADTLIDAIGSIDEANSYLGIISSGIKNQQSKAKIKIQYSKIEEIQKNLFSIGATLAGATTEGKSASVELITDSNAEELEKEIDRMEKDLPKLTGFILPGGSMTSSHLMYVRTLIRKAERRIVFLIQDLQFKNCTSILKYMNRLSDYLFVLARWENYKNKIQEIRWK